MNKDLLIEKLKLLHNQKLEKPLNDYYEISKELHSAYIDLLKNIIITFGKVQKWNKCDHSFDMERYIINEGFRIKLLPRDVNVDNNYGCGIAKNSIFDCVSIYYVKYDSRAPFRCDKCFAYIYVWGDTEEISLDYLSLDDLIRIYDYFIKKFNIL